MVKRTAAGRSRWRREGGFRRRATTAEGELVAGLARVGWPLPKSDKYLQNFATEKHVQCTEERPECSRCKRLNLGCAYGLRLLWREDAAQRGICLGREGI